MINISVVPMVRRVLENKGLTSADVARTFKLNPSSAYGMLHRNTLQVHRLIGLSEMLNYNFFREIAQQLPFVEPDYSADDKKTELELRERIKMLELEVGILKQTLRDLAGAK